MWWHGHHFPCSHHSSFRFDLAAEWWIHLDHRGAWSLFFLCSRSASLLMSIMVIFNVIDQYMVEHKKQDLPSPHLASQCVLSCTCHLLVCVVKWEIGGQCESIGLGLAVASTIQYFNCDQNTGPMEKWGSASREEDSNRTLVSSFPWDGSGGQPATAETQTLKMKLSITKFWGQI